MKSNDPDSDDVVKGLIDRLYSFTDLEDFVSNYIDIDEETGGDAFLIQKVVQNVFDKAVNEKNFAIMTNLLVSVSQSEKTIMRELFRSNPQILSIEDQLVSYVKENYKDSKFAVKRFRKIFNNARYDIFVSQENFLDVIKSDEGLKLFNEVTKAYRKTSNYRQKHLINKIILYIEMEHKTRSENLINNYVAVFPENELRLRLKKERELRLKKNRELRIRKRVDADVALLKEESNRGYCSGLSFLYLAYKTFGEEDVFFKKLQVISEWDGSIDSLDPDEKLIFEAIISQIIFAHDLDFVRKRFGVRLNLHQSDPLRLSKALSPNLLLKCMSRRIFTETGEINDYLKDLPNNSIVEVRTYVNSHSMAIYKEKEGEYYFYDPNNTFGEVDFQEPSGLIDFMFKAIKNIGTVESEQKEPIKFLFSNYSRLENVLNEALKMLDCDPIDLKGLNNKICYLMKEGFESECEFFMHGLIRSNKIDNDKKRDLCLLYADLVESKRDIIRLKKAIDMVIEVGEDEAAALFWMRAHMLKLGFLPKLKPYNEKLMKAILIWFGKENEFSALTNFLIKNPEALNFEKTLIAHFSGQDSVVKGIEESFSAIRLKQEADKPPTLTFSPALASTMTSNSQVKEVTEKSTNLPNPKHDPKIF